MSKHRRARSVRSRLVGLVVPLLAVAIPVWAYWSGAGAGSAGAATRTVVALTVTPGTPSAPVRPGATAPVALSVTNPNPVPVRLESLALDTSRGTSGFAVDAAHASCGLGSLSFVTQNNGGSGWSITAGGSLVIELSGALSMAADAADACQGATFTVYLRAGP